MKLKKPTKQQHIDTGTELIALDAQIQALERFLSIAYGVASIERKNASKARKALLVARSELENRYCLEHPTCEAATHVYFGSVDSRAHFGIITK